MTKKLFLGILLLAACVAISSPTTVSAAGSSGPAGGMTQFDVALEIYQAVDVNDGSATAARAMLALQARGFVPQSWNGLETVTMADVGQVMDKMGIEVGISTPNDTVGTRDLDQLLKAHQAELGVVGSEWDDGEQFPTSAVLGTRQRRIVSSSDF